MRRPSRGERRKSEEAILLNLERRNKPDLSCASTLLGFMSFGLGHTFLGTVLVCRGAGGLSPQPAMFVQCEGMAGYNCSRTCSISRSVALRECFFGFSKLSATNKYHQGSLKDALCQNETWLFPPKQRDTTIYKSMFRCIM